MFSAGSQSGKRVDGENKQLAINGNVPKFENKSLGTSHLLLTCVIDVCVLWAL